MIERYEPNSSSYSPFEFDRERRRVREQFRDGSWTPWRPAQPETPTHQVRMGTHRFVGPSTSVPEGL